MNLRKCEATQINREDQIEGLFHRWYVDEDGDLRAIVEQKNGQVVRCQGDVKFLEPARQRVEVTLLNRLSKTGYLIGWYQSQNDDGPEPAAVVEHDDGTHGEYPAHRVRIIKEVPNE